MAKAGEPDPSGLVAGGPQPCGGGPSRTDQGLPEPADTPGEPARRPKSSKPEPPGPGQQRVNPKASL